MPNDYAFKENEIPYLNRAEQYCAQNEQCRSAVMDKLALWGAHHDLAEKIVDYLVKNDFINETRYCLTYSESKLHLQKWGRIKIAYQLRAKRIEKKKIDEALQHLDPEQYRDTLYQLAVDKNATLHEDDPRKRQAKLVSFLSSHGFEMDEIMTTLGQINGKEQN